IVLGMPPELLYGRILPGAAVSLVVGNLFYAWQGRPPAARPRPPHGGGPPPRPHTPSPLRHPFLIPLPPKPRAAAGGAADPARVAWQAGLVACLGSGVIELALAPAADAVRRASPRAALLSTLAGIALGFISLGFFFRTFAHPMVGLATLAIVLVTYFGRVGLRGGLPGGLVAVTVGTALAWLTGIAPGVAPVLPAALHLPQPALADLVA